MSTYLLAFVIFEKDSFSSPANQAGGPFRTYGRTSVIGDKSEQSQQDGPAMITYLDTYTGVTYYGTVTAQNNSMGMLKMDQAAIPDFLTGAMENWGLNTYKESALLIEEGGSSAAKKRISEVIAHELAHHWFGNWVTTKWWDTTWLNEGFARLFENYVMINHYPNWRMPERMVLDVQMDVFEADSRKTASPLTNPAVESPEQISDHFSIISYGKGGSILRQISNVLGADAFQTAIKAYLKKMAFNSAEPKDLFEEFVDVNDEDDTGVNNVDLEKVLDNWTTKPGYPVVTVTRKSATEATIKQSRFLLPDSAISNDDRHTYYVYLTWVTNSATTPPTEPVRAQLWMKPDEAEVTVGGLPENWEWIIVNPLQAGYYRVDYEKYLWNKLSDVVRNSDNVGKFSAIDRAALINNALSLCRDASERNIDYENALFLMTFLRNDLDFAPWAAARSSLAHIQRIVGSETAYRIFINTNIDNAFKAVSFEVPDNEGDNNVEKTHRVNILTLACSANNIECIDESEKRLQEYLMPADGVESKPVHVDIQSVVYCYGLKKESSAANLWDRLWALYVASRWDMTRRALIASALGCVKNDAKLKEYLDKSVDGSSMPQHEASTAFSAVYSNLDNGAQVALQYLNDNFDTLESKYGESSLKSLVIGLAEWLTTAEQKTQLQGVLPDDYQTSALSTIDANIKWKSDNQDSVMRGLRRGGAPTIALASTLALLCAALLALFR